MVGSCLGIRRVLRVDPEPWRARALTRESSGLIMQTRSLPLPVLCSCRILAQVSLHPRPRDCVGGARYGVSLQSLVISRSGREKRNQKSIKQVNSANVESCLIWRGTYKHSYLADIKHKHGEKKQEKYFDNWKSTLQKAICRKQFASSAEKINWSLGGCGLNLNEQFLSSVRRSRAGVMQSGVEEDEKLSHSPSWITITTNNPCSNTPDNVESKHNSLFIKLMRYLFPKYLNG